MATGKIGITGRKNNKLAIATAQNAIKILQKKGIDFVVNSDFLKISGKNKELTDFDCDLAVSFGGDGALLATFQELGKKIPVMGVNCGRKGFLQAYRHDEIEEAICAIAAKKYKIEERTRILARVDGRVVGSALNEVLIVPDKSGRILEYKIMIGANERTEAGDGLIVATPTGSTAHALSAGGPVVKGNASVFVVVSINPVEWSHRPLVINDHEKILISDFRNMKAQAVLDGQKWFAVREKAELEKGSGVLLATKIQ